MEQHPPIYALVNLTCLDVDSGTLSGPASIVIDNGRISDVRADPSSEGLPEIRYDCAGLIALPGLIDMHVHVCHSAEHGPALTEAYWESDVAMTVNALKNMDRALKAGITSLRDLGGALNFLIDLRYAQQKGRIPGPRLFIAGHMLTAVGGHGMESGMNMGYEVCGVDEMRRAVREHIARRVDLIKLCTSSENMPTALTLAELTAGVEEAHFQGKKVACHANFRRSSIDDAVAAGCDTIEHGVAIDEQIADRMAAQGTILCPTLGIVRASFNTALAKGATGGPILSKVESHQRAFRLARERGLTIVGGTDAGWAGMPFDALHEEMQIMGELGMSRLETLQAVTSKAADTLDAADKVGRLKAGAFADLLLVERNPLDGLDVLRQPQTIIANGRLISGSLFETIEQ